MGTVDLHFQNGNLVRFFRLLFVTFGDETGKYLRPNSKDAFVHVELSLFIFIFDALDL